MRALANSFVAARVSRRIAQPFRMATKENEDGSCETGKRFDLGVDLWL